MKSLLVVLLLVSSQAFSAQKHEVINSNTHLLVNGSLRCEVEAGDGDINDRIKTVLGDKLARGVKEGTIIGAELNHKFAIGSGCDQAALDKIVDDARMSYGYVHVAVRIVKDTSESRLNGFGKCIATYEETLVVYLALGITLKSQQAELRKATDCK